MDYWNARLGCVREGKIIGEHGLGKESNRGYHDRILYQTAFIGG